MESLERRLALTGLSLLYNGVPIQSGDTIELGEASFDPFEFKLTADASASSEVIGEECVHITRFSIPSSFQHQSTPIGCLPAGSSQDVDVAFASMSESDEYDFIVEYENGGLTEKIEFTADLQVSPDALRVEGDINGDRAVDFVDFLILSDNFGSSVEDGSADGDFDNSGRVEFADFLLLSHNFGTSLAAGGNNGVEGSVLSDQLKPRTDSYVVVQDTRLVVGADQGVLSNDVGRPAADVPGGQVPDAIPLTAELIEPPAVGQVKLNSDGSFDYTPAPEYIGNVEFKYLPRDSAQGRTETVKITVLSEYTSSTAIDDRYTTRKNNVLVVDSDAGLLTNDNDEADPLSAAVFEQPKHGYVSIDADGSFVYTPDANFSGVDQFTYVANDLFFSSTPATVTVLVI